jgi:regulator of sigma E protease
MFGDDPFNKDSIPEEQREYSFNHKGKWARFWIVLGGPLANFILAFFIFFGLLLSGEKMPEMRLGVVFQKGAFYSQGLRSGDILKKINGQKIYNISDIALQKGGKITSLTVGRKKKDKVLKVNFLSDKFFKEFIKYPPLLRKPFLVNPRGEKFYISQTEKVTKEVKGKSLDTFSVENKSDETFLFKVPKKGQIGHLLRNPEKLKLPFKSTKDLLDSLRKKHNLYSLDLLVKSVRMGSPADKAGIRSNDIIFSIDEENVTSFDDLKKTLQNGKEGNVQLSVWREGVEKTFTLKPEIQKINKKEVKIIGVWSSGEYLPLNFVSTESKGLWKSLSIGLFRTWDSIEKTMTGFKKLVTSESSLKNIGGPLSIGKVAADSFNTSLSYFFQLMALISVNLGIINLFPIPVLDGGHIMFLFLEIINRGPLSRRKMEIAQQLGLSLLLMLMVGAIFNDVTRFF